jgi:peptidoglycan-associated lipoprotein
MRNFMKTFIVVIGLLFLVGCASSRNGGPAGVTDANALYGGGASGAKSMGLGNEDNLVGKDAGPAQGVLGKRSFYFAFNSSDVNKQYISIIQAHGEYLLKHPNARLLLEGNADIRGSREYNIALGQQRADAVENILKMEGVNSKQIRTISYGAEKPIAMGRTEAAYRLNRRVDLVYEAN